ncbi:hypothetical protein [Streptomyces sp. NPDC090022]|uniref:hypothetical protein n=1 Tax=Streptomyces sp. NPDC090022 TaxID=3365920 RepID=UPI0038229C87
MLKRFVLALSVVTAALLMPATAAHAEEGGTTGPAGGTGHPRVVLTGGTHLGASGGLRDQGDTSWGG